MNPTGHALIESEFSIVDLVNGKEWSDISDTQEQRALVFRQGLKNPVLF